MISVSDGIAGSGVGGWNSRVTILTGMIIMQRSMFYSFVLSIVWKYGNGPALRGSSIPEVHLGLGLGLVLGLWD